MPGALIILALCPCLSPQRWQWRTTGWSELLRGIDGVERRHETACAIAWQPKLHLSTCATTVLEPILIIVEHLTDNRTSQGRTATIGSCAHWSLQGF